MLITPSTLDERFKDIGVERSDLNKDQWQLFFECRYRLLVHWLKIGDLPSGQEIRTKCIYLLPPAK